MGLFDELFAWLDGDDEEGEEWDDDDDDDDQCLAFQSCVLATVSTQD